MTDFFIILVFFHGILVSSDSYILSECMARAEAAYLSDTEIIRIVCANSDEVYIRDVSFDKWVHRVIRPGV